MKKKLLLAGLFLGGLIIVLVWVQGGFHSKVPAGRTPILQKKPAAGKTFKVEITRSTGQVTVPGSVVPREKADIASRGQGYAVEIKVSAGDQVKKGDLLIRLDNKDVADRKAQAEAALDSARADLVKAETDYQRFKNLFEKESVAEKVFDDAAARYNVARAAQLRAGAALEEARTILSYGRITAPFDGIVAEESVNLGDLVSPGRVLFRIYAPGSAEMVARPGEQYAPFLKVGTTVSVAIPSMNLSQEAKLREVVPQRDEKTRTITVKAPLTHVPGLGPGLYGTMTFNTKSVPVILIPKKAVRVVGQLETVRVLESQALRVRHVKIGRTIHDKVEVLSGLSPGEEVVLE